MKYLIFIGVFLISSIASAQTPHPCDVTTFPNVAVAGQPFAISFCNDGKVPITSYTVLLDPQLDASNKPIPQTGTLVPNPGPLTKSATANNAGQYLFSTPSTIVVNAEGQHKILVGLKGSGGDSPLSDPFTFSIVLAPPSQPVKLRVVQ